MLRTARVDDSVEIARCHVRSWQKIYRGHIADEYLDNLDPARRSEQWKFQLRDPSVTVAVCESGSNIVGFVCLAPSRDTNAAPGSIELVAIYVDPDHWREGIGRTLIEWAQDWAQEHEAREMTLWVLRENARARAFYKDMGWSETRDLQNETIGGTEITEVKYRWPGVAY